MIISLILACALCFVTGYVLGNKTETRFISKAEKKRLAEINKLHEELKNFLEYDGTEQL